MGFPSTIYGAEKDVYETGAVQLYPIGQRLELPNGGVFHYAEKGSTNAIANNLQQSEAATANWNDQDIGTAMVVGDTSILVTIGATAIAVNELAGGTIILEDAADKGHIYLIKSNVANAGTAESEFILEDGVTVQAAVAVVANNAITLIKNPWKDFIISPAGINAALNAGIPRVIIAANAFGWLQTSGVASCLVDADTTGGLPLTGNTLRSSNEVAGAVTILDEVAGDAEVQIVGTAIDSVVDTMFATVYLTLNS